MSNSKFYLRLTQGNKVLYESPTEGDDVELIKPQDNKTVAENFVDAINKVAGSILRAKLVKDA